MSTEANRATETGEPVVVGLDSGGTHTRALCAAKDGTILARFQSGAGHPSKNPHAQQEVKAAVLGVLEQADRTTAQVRACVAGLAGLNSQEDLAWAEPFLAVPGLPNKADCVNDAVVAWAGALGLQPGIVAIAGTGAIVFGVTETGRHVRDYDFRHYGDLRARDLVAALVHQIVIGEGQEDDADLIAAVYRHFGVNNRTALAQLAATADRQPSDQFIRTYGSLAPFVTAAAANGAPLARIVCDTAIHVMAISIRLVASQFKSERIRVALNGSVLRSDYVSERLTEVLRAQKNQQFEVIQPRMPADAGATLLALKQCGITISSTILENLAR